MKLSVVIPVYNEIDTLEEILSRVMAVDIEKEVICVDDGSTDGSREWLVERAESADDIRVVLHDHNRGKGAALRSGFDVAVGDIVLIQDADLEYDPNDYPALLEPFEKAGADVVYGSRFAGGRYQRVHLFYHRLGNMFLTTLSNMFTNLNLTDMETCYKVFRKEVLDGITIKSRSFTVEPELTAKVARGGWRIFEVPISYAGRDYDEGKKIGWRDGMKALFAIIRYRFTD